MKTIYQDFKNNIETNYQINKESASIVKGFLDKSSVAFQERCTNTLHIPKVFTKAEVETFRHIVSTTYTIFEKIIKEYLDNPSYRKLFPFSKEIEELILIPNLYDSVLPIARFDIFFNEEDGTFKFCEINTDGTSAMNEDRELNESLQFNFAYQDLNQRYHFQSFELLDSWVDIFMKLYNTYEKRVEKPFIAIVDFMEGGTTSEFAEFKKRFENAGYSVEICEIRKLRYVEGVLYSPEGRKIDVIYRRAVTSDVEKYMEEIPDFIQAIKDQNVCLIGSFCTQIIHNKWLFKVIKEKETLALLSKEEQAFVLQHIPTTWLLKEGEYDQEKVMEDKNKWIIKPLDSYASKGVFAGVDTTFEEWKHLIKNFLGQGYIVQEYCTPYCTLNIDFQEEEPALHPYTNMTGLFVYNGVFAGAFSRLSDGGIISSQYNERSVATIIIEGNDE